MVRIPIAVLRTIFAVVVQGMTTLVIASYLIVLTRMRPRTSQVPRVVRIWAKIFLFATGTRVKIDGIDRIDPTGSYVVVGNHSSILDIPVIMGMLPVSVRFLAKKELFKVPVLGKAMRSIHMIETDRRAGPTAHRAINEQVATVVAAGLSLMIFPEGTRSADGAMLPFKKGAFRMAVDNEMPVLPVTIIGAQAAWKSHGKLIYGGKVRVVIHAPISTRRMDRTMLDDLRDRVRDTVAESLGRQGATRR